MIKNFVALFNCYNINMEILGDPFIDCNNEKDIIKKYLSEIIPNNYIECSLPGLNLYIINLCKNNYNFFMKISIIDDSNNDMDGLIYSSEYIFYNDYDMTEGYVCRETLVFRTEWEQYNNKIYEILSTYYDEYII